MRAFAVRNFGEAAALYDLPIPGADGAFLIRVKYAGINLLDNILVERLTATAKYPFVLGVDFAGIVDRVPEGELSLRVGDRIFGMARTHEAYAEVARMLADGTITARIHSIIQPDHIGEAREELRNGGLRGKAVIRF